jgi:hypothetical protein
VFTTVKFRFTLYGKVADDTISPNPLPLTFIFQKQPGLRMSYLFHVDVSRNIDEGVVANFATLHTAIKALWNTKTLLDFVYADITATKVKIVSMPTSEQELRNTIRRGSMTVQVYEPVDF